MADQDLDRSDSQDISEIRRKALALLERCGTTDSDGEIPDYDDDDHSEDESLELEMRNIRSSEIYPTTTNMRQRKSLTPRNSRTDKSETDEADVDEEKGTSTDGDDEESYGDEELDPLVKAVRELSYSLETDMLEQQGSNVSRLTEDLGNTNNNNGICCCCNCCCCQRWSRRTQCLVVWILLILLLVVSYWLCLTQYPYWKRKHDGV